MPMVGYRKKHSHTKTDADFVLLYKDNRTSAGASSGRVITVIAHLLTYLISTKNQLAFLNMCLSTPLIIFVLLSAFHQPAIYLQ